MNNIPPALRKDMALDPYYHACARNALLQDHICQPDPLTNKLIDWEHAMIYAHKQVQKKWAIVPICWWAHRGPGLVKEINVWIALNRASNQELRDISKAVDYIKMRAYLNQKYGDQKNQPILSTIGF